MIYFCNIASLRLDLLHSMWTEKEKLRRKRQVWLKVWSKVHEKAQYFMGFRPSNLMSKYFERQKLLCSRAPFIYDQESKCMFSVLDKYSNHRVIHNLFIIILYTKIQGTFHFYKITYQKLSTGALIQKSVIFLKSSILSLMK